MKNIGPCHSSSGENLRIMDFSRTSKSSRESKNGRGFKFVQDQKEGTITHATGFPSDGLPLVCHTDVVRDREWARENWLHATEKCSSYQGGGASPGPGPEPYRKLRMWAPLCWPEGVSHEH